MPKPCWKAVLLTACIASLSALPAVAHSTKETSDPADGSVLAEAPETITMTFDSPLRVTLIRLTNGDGVEIPLERDGGTDMSTRVVAIPGPTPPGRYLLEWRGLAEDGHAMQGSFAFEIED